MLDELDDYVWGDDETLITLGFKRWDEATGDSIRRLEFHRVVRRSFAKDDSGYELRLRLKYTVYVSDDPNVPTSDNFDHSYEGAFLQVVNDETRETVIEFPVRIGTLGALQVMMDSLDFTGSRGFKGGGVKE